MPNPDSSREMVIRLEFRLRLRSVLAEPARRQAIVIAVGLHAFESDRQPSHGIRYHHAIVFSR